MYVDTYAYMYVCTYMYASHTWIHKNVCMYAYMHTYI